MLPLFEYYVTSSEQQFSDALKAFFLRKLEWHYLTNQGPMKNIGCTNGYSRLSDFGLYFDITYLL